MEVEERPNNGRYFVQNRDDMNLCNESGCFIDDEDDNVDSDESQTHFQVLNTDLDQDHTNSQKQSARTVENFSESKVPVTSVEGSVPQLNYKTSEGVLKKINKLNLN